MTLIMHFVKTPHKFPLPLTELRAWQLYSQDEKEKIANCQRITFQLHVMETAKFIEHFCFGRSDEKQILFNMEIVDQVAQHSFHLKISFLCLNSLGALEMRTPLNHRLLETPACSPRGVRES